MCCVQGFGEPRLLSPPPIPTPTPKLQEGFQTLPTDPPTGVDDPNYENITVTLRKQDHPKDSHSPPKSEGKRPCQPTSHSFGRGLWGGALQGQWAALEARIGGVGCGDVKACETVVGAAL